MIIACPACSTRYVVPDSAIGVEGRTVRCAKCRHSWFQDGPELDLASMGAETAPEPASPAPPPPSQAEPSPPQAAAPRSTEPAPAHSRATAGDDSEFDWGEPPETAAENAVPPPPDYAATPAPAPTVVETAPTPEPEPAYTHDVSQFDYEPPFRPRRNPLKLWTIAGVVFAALALGTVAAVSYVGLPDWVPVSKPVFGPQQADLVLDFPKEKQDRRQLPNGTEYFGASGTITNVGRETRTVPPILINLRDERERIVYTWEIAPPQPTLAPGEVMTINEAATDVPRSARIAEVGWKPQ